MKKLIVLVLIMATMLTMVFIPVNAADCAHSYVVTDYDVVSHTQTCELCGDVQTSAHTWGAPYYVSEEELENHYLDCSVCGQKKTETHSWVKGPNLMFFLKTGLCSKCDLNKLDSMLGKWDGSASAASCTHHYGVESYDNDSHTLVCRHCGTKQTAAHSWGEGVEDLSNSRISYTCTGGCIKSEPIEISWEEVLFINYETGYLNWKDDVADTIQSKLPKEEKVVSEYVGAIGDKLDIEVTFKREIQYERASFSGWGTELVSIYIFTDDNGNILIWNTTACPKVEAGKRYRLKGTVAEHKEYAGDKQTALKRCKVQEVA